MSETIEMGTVSSRGQLCIPSNIRANMGLEDGSKVLFVQQNDSLLIKKVTMQSFQQITKPLKEAAKKANMLEANANELVHTARRSGK